MLYETNTTGIRTLFSTRVMFLFQSFRVEMPLCEVKRDALAGLDAFLFLHHAVVETIIIAGQTSIKAVDTILVNY